MTIIRKRITICIYFIHQKNPKSYENYILTQSVVLTSRLSRTKRAKATFSRAIVQFTREEIVIFRSTDASIDLRRDCK